VESTTANNKTVIFAFASNLGVNETIFRFQFTTRCP